MTKDSARKSPPLIQIIPPTKEENRYRYRIRAGIDYNAFLTYELPTTSDERSILLINGSQQLPTTTEQNAEYERLVDRIGETLGRFTGAKNIVNRIAEGEFANLPNVRIAVHKYGPVPVYVLPETYSIGYFGGDIQAQIGIYPKIAPLNGGRRGVNLQLPFLGTKAEFVRSLNVGLGLMFQRYLEDVGEGMYDIKHHLNLAGTFDRAKEIEETLAESIRSKLDVAMPSAAMFRHPQSEDEKLVKALFEKEYNWIFTARYARQFALYFLNELYRMIGVESRSDSYLGGFGAIRDEFNALLGKDYVKNALRELPLVALLSRALRAYRDGDNDTLREINVDGETLWVRRFVQFARFVASINLEQLPPTTGRIFISYQHDVPVTEVLLSRINDYIKSNFPNRVEVLSVRETGTGVRFKSPIRARIWLSDTVSEIVPKSSVNIAGNTKNYNWIAHEAEYGLLLGKRIIYLVEKGADEAQIRAELKNRSRDGGLIPSSARVPDWLQERLLESFTEYTRAMFAVDTTQTSEQDLDPSIIRAIHGEAEKAIERRHRDILVGFHRQFPESARRTLKHIQETVPYPKVANKKALASQLVTKYKSSYKDQKSAEKAITNTWNLARYRALLIGERSMPLMRLLDGKNYSGNLREIMKALRQDLSKTKIDEWERTVLTASVTEDGSELA